MFKKVKKKKLLKNNLKKKIILKFFTLSGMSTQRGKSNNKYLAILALP